MSAVSTDEQPLHPHVRRLSDSRPPPQTWARSAIERNEQPTLIFAGDPAVDRKAAQPRGHRVHVVSHPGSPAPSSVLPDVRTWSASLALAIAEALQGRRPVGQLSRWVDEHVLATLSLSVSPRLPAGGRQVGVPLRPTALHSVHLQLLQPEVVEASAHIQTGGRSTAIAFRLEAWFGRWICTALELGPRDQEI